MANSRLSHRASFFAEVDVLSMSDAMPQRVWGQNLSEAGMFLQTTRSFHPGDRVALRFDVEDNEVHVRAAEVVWVKPFEPISVDGMLPGIGVRFLSVDPPSRAAIRRYISELMPAVEPDPPAPPPEPELPAGCVSLESLKPLSLPPFDSAPPLVETAARASLPPDDGAIDDEEHPLAGWRFEVERSLPPMALVDEGEVSGPSLHDTLPPPAISLPPFDEKSEEHRWSPAGLSFSDSAPPALAASPPLPAPLTELPAPTLAERAPDALAIAKHHRLDDEFFAGKLSVLELPQVEARGRGDARSTRRMRVAWAAALLVAGGGLGVWMGYQPASHPLAAQPATKSAAPAPSTTSPPRSVAEAERELAVVDEEAAAARPAAPEKVPFVSPAQIATSTTGSLPKKAPAPDVALTSSSASAAPPPSPAGIVVEHGRITVPLEGGRVAKAFALSGPSRAVVDLVDATFPGHKHDEVGDKGVVRVRYGRPDPTHVRVVVELAGKPPRDITTHKRGASLSIAWK